MAKRKPTADEAKNHAVEESRGEGNLPLAEIEKVKGQLNKQLVEDYTYWFWNNR